MGTTFRGKSTPYISYFIIHSLLSSYLLVFSVTTTVFKYLRNRYAFAQIRNHLISVQHEIIIYKRSNFVVEYTLERDITEGEFSLFV